MADNDDEQKYPKEQNEEPEKAGFANPFEDLDVEMIIAVDFGSFGFASAFCEPGMPNNLKVVQDWANARAATELNKNLAALLVDKETKETVAFGYDAEEKYAKMQESKDADKVMYFEHFKPYLYSQDGQHLDKNIEVPCQDGSESLPLADLITKSLQAVMEHSLQYINAINKMAGVSNLEIEKVFWVITVPAIWDEMSKEMMKFCAKCAGMVHFELGSEPVVSTFFVLNSQGKEFQLTKNDKIVVLDCGGGTIDCSCMEIMSKQYDLSELHHGDGILSGGLKVDKKFKALLNEILPKELLDDVKAKNAAQWVRQRQEFVMARFTVPFSLDDDQLWNVPLCFPIAQYLSRKKKKKRKDPEYNNIKTKIETYAVPRIVYGKQKENNEKKEDLVVGAYQLGRANLKISKMGWLHLHEDVLDDIVGFLKRLFKDGSVKSCRSVILVGGFANSKYLINRLLAEFPNKQFHSPRQPHLSVVQGALYYVNQRKKLRKTRAKYSYGISIDRKWNANTDDKKRRVDHITLGAIVENCFGKIVERNEEYEDGHREEFEYWIPANAKQVQIDIYASEDQFCRYVCNLDGSLQCFIVKRFELNLDEKKEEKRLLTIILIYNQSGINLSFKDPNDETGKKEIQVKVDITTTKKPSTF